GGAPGGDFIDPFSSLMLHVTGLSVNCRGDVRFNGLPSARMAKIGSARLNGRGRFHELAASDRRLNMVERGLQQGGSSDIEGEAMTHKEIRVLIVDDRQDDRELLAGRLRLEEDFAVGTASNGDDALAQIRAAQGQYDVILMDIQLGGNPDGIETMQRIK